uniref:Pf1-cadherin n=1 Tax=Ptychodera flava TaxID=63121 RepID=Q8MY75_PTYFL|nr:Pf1-cadherin [Ptychodera flava]
MALIAIFTLTLVSLQQLSTDAMPFSHLKIPCHIMPGSEITRLNHKGQQYSLHEESDPEVASLFGVTEDGIIRSMEELTDYANRMFSVVVEQFLDDDAWKDSFNIYITKSGDNSEHLKFTQDRYEGSVLENSPAGTVVYGFESISACSECDLVEYSLLGTGEEKFNLENKDGIVTIQTNEVLDRESRASYNLTLVAASASLETETTDLLITVEDVNDNAPEFDPETCEVTVPEISPADAIVAYVHAVDPDAGKNGKVMYYTDTNDMTFSVHPDTGGVIIGGPLQAKEYTLTVFARDRGKPSLEASTPGRVIITVTPVDQSLKFSSILGPGPVILQDDDEELPEIKVSLMEDAPKGSVVTTIKAPSNDKSSQYRFLMNNPMNPRFHVQYYTGDIVLTGRLDIDAHPTEEINVGITKDFNDPLREAPKEQKVIITIIPSETDKPAPPNQVVKPRIRRASKPSFDQPSYEGTVEEVDGLASPVPAFVPREILTVRANGDPSNIQYRIQQAEFREDFAIGLTSGIISSRKHLDREDNKGQVREFTVTASNSAGTTSVEVLIKIKDVNDNAPQFPYPPYIGSFPENGAPGVTVMTIQAEDLDDPNEGGNALVRYSILRNAQNSVGQAIFAIDSESAVITTQVGNLDREEIPSYDIVVKAVDGGAHTGTVTATIYVSDENDNPPEFPQAKSFVEISENVPVDSSVFKVIAIDRDVGINSYSIISGNVGEKFRIETDPDSGYAIVKVAKKIDFELNESKFVLTIEVDDSKNTATTELDIRVMDANDEVPSFSQPRYLAEHPEDFAKWTTIGTVAATDRDKSEKFSEIEFEVVRVPEFPDSSFFTVGSANGSVMAIKDLDREPYEDPDQIRENYIFTVTATDNVRGQSGERRNTATVTFTVSITDVNDNAPEFLPGYTLLVPENTPAGYEAGVVEIIDRDDDSNGPPFTHRVIDDDGILSFFDVSSPIGVEDQLRVVSLEEFDREATPFYYIPVVLSDKHGVSATQTLTVTIGDVNDNPPSPATKTILVYSYKGQIPRSAIGEVYAADEDIVKGDDISYTVTTPIPQFSVDKDTGQIIIEENTKAGTYDFKVEVDEKPWPPVICTVIVEVKDIPEEAVFSSGSVRLLTSAEKFIRGTPSMKDRFHDILVDVLGAKKENIDIFSVINVPGEENQCDVRWSAHGSPYYRPEKMNTQLLLAKDVIESQLGVSFGMVPIDMCLDEGICESSCTNYFNAITDPTIIDDGADTFVSVTTIQRAECVCGAKLAPRGPCASNPCLNGGQCIDTPSGYVCQCDEKYGGPNCEDISRGFQSNSFAWYPPLSQCEETKTSIEFLTKSRDGIILYNGPIVPIDLGQPQDFMAIELVGGKPKLYMDLGSGMLPLTIDSPPLNDEKWHTLEIIRKSKHVEFVLDHCENAVITETERTSVSDESNCKATDTTPGTNRFLNVNTPLQLGGIDMDSTYTYPNTFNFAPGGDFVGCIRNVIQDGKVYDLGTPGREKNSEQGCPQTDLLCYVDGVYVCKNGLCVTESASVYTCVCDPGWGGEACDEELPSYDFLSDSYVIYDLEASLVSDKYMSDYQIMVGNTQEEDALLMHLQNVDGEEYITMKMKEGNAFIEYNLGDPGMKYSLRVHNYTINDGNYHTVRLLRYGNIFRFEVDGGGGVRTVEKAQGIFKEFIPDPKSVIVGANVSLSEMRVLGDDYSGCAKDARISNSYIGFDGEIDGTIAVPNRVEKDCNICLLSPCIAPLVCVPTPSFYYCSCPGDLVFRGGACVKEGGPAPQTGAAGLSLAALIAILLCIFILLVLILAFIVYKRHAQKDKGALVLDVDEDDLHENVVVYDDEGGGEEDYDAYDINTLRKPVDPALESPVIPKKKQPVSETPRTRPNLPPGAELPDIGDFLDKRQNDADDDPEAPPYDTLRVYNFEGEGSTAGSLSSLNTSGSGESEQNFDYLKDLGPPFKKLADMYGGEED